MDKEIEKMNYRHTLRMQYLEEGKRLVMAGDFGMQPLYLYLNCFGVFNSYISSNRIKQSDNTELKNKPLLYVKK